MTATHHARHPKQHEDSHQSGHGREQGVGGGHGNGNGNGNGMLDDTYWAAFTSNANDYELGSTIGFGASSTVYTAAFTLPLLRPLPQTEVYSSVGTPANPSTSSASSPNSKSNSRSIGSTPSSDHDRTAKNTPNLSINIPQLPTPSAVPPSSSTSGSAAGSASASDDNTKRDRAGLYYEEGHADGAGEERECAIKVSTSHPDVNLLFKETRLLTLCRHPNVLRILATFTFPPDHARIAIVTPLITGGSLAGILDWRSRLITTPKTHHFPSFRIHNHKHKFKPKHKHGKRGEEEDEDDPDGFGEGVEKGRLDEEEIKCVIKQVLEGLEYLHSNGFLHRDLKAGNLLIDNDGTILLADFGVGGDLNQPASPVRSRKSRIAADELRFQASPTNTGEDADGNANGKGDGPRSRIVNVHGNAEYASLGPGRKNGTGRGTGIAAEQQNQIGFQGGSELAKRKSFVGTPNWMAPEVVLGQKYDTKADIWSLGITILELAYGAVPRAKDKANVVLAHIVTDAPPTLDRSVGGFSKQMKEFVDLCLNKDPNSRPTAAHLLDNHWLKGAKKKSWLAQSLLTDVPPLTSRQELRRIPTMSSFVSRASSWDFSTTPSMPSSPIRSSLLLNSARSPSLSSHLGEYFPAAGRTHSRGSSFSVTPALGASASGTLSIAPPSPRVSLKQWAERGGNPEEWSGSLSVRTGSERGNRRSLSSAGQRRGKSASFDLRPNTFTTPYSSGQGQQAVNGGKNDEGSRPRALSGLASPPSPSISKSKREMIDMPEKSGSGKTPMSPLLEATRSGGGDGAVGGYANKSHPPGVTDGILGLGIAAIDGEMESGQGEIQQYGQGLSESPETLLELPARIEGERRVRARANKGTPESSHVSEQGVLKDAGPESGMNTNTTLVANPQEAQTARPSSSVPSSIYPSSSSSPTQGSDSHTISTTSNKVTPELPAVAQSSNAMLSLNGGRGTVREKEKEKDKRHWLSRKGSVKHSESRNGFSHSHTFTASTTVTSGSDKAERGTGNGKNGDGNSANAGAGSSQESNRIGSKTKQIPGHREKNDRLSDENARRDQEGAGPTSTSMGRTSSWTGVFGRVANKIHKR